MGCSKDSDSPNNPVKDPAITAAQQAAIIKSIDSLLLAENIPGVAFGIWRGSKEPVLIARGLADVAAGRALTVNDRFRIASNTKMFTAQVILQLADSQKLSLDEPISTWFTNVPNAHSITVRQLLRMESGLGDYASDNSFFPTYVNSPTNAWSRSTMYNMICGIATEFNPGDSCVYCNSNYYLLGMIIEKVTGHKVEDEIRNRIIIPWGLTNTEFPTTDQITGTYSHGYRDHQGTINSDVTAVHPSGPWTGGAMISTLEDMKTFVQSINQGRGLSDSMKQQRFSWRAMAPHMWYGLGAMNWAGLRGHNGAILGFNSFIVYLPAWDLTYVAFVNKCTEVDNKYYINYVCGIIFQNVFGSAYPFE
jgi:D-alanyl-D-alanine carboxypeptidase